MPCRIAFERGKERHFCFLAISVGTSGWLVLAEELPLKKPFGVVRVAAPLAGCNVCIFVCYLCIFISNQVVWIADNYGANLCYWFSLIQWNREYNLKNVIFTITFTMITWYIIILQSFVLCLLSI